MVALVYGMQLCKDLGITNYVPEVNSSIVYNMARKQGVMHWRHIYLLGRLWELIDPSWHLNLIAEEHNMKIQKLLFFDRIGLPVF